ncbi:MAG: 2,3-bisphosphoglycerate-independent phosphoglycerate mutase [Anaerolineales bacterium]|nr:2,3-bisphosphoglycerate-independent phosphoglycerate mutase [Anaerolineales bacterium]
MADFELIRSLAQGAKTKIVLLVLDGLGGIPAEAGGPTELEAAQKPNLNRLAAEGCLGQMNPVGYGITPGSGPGHLSLFGYDPLKFDIGRGVLEAFGIGVDVGADDVAARGNFCTVDSDGRITDRRAGRIPTESSSKLVEKLAKIRIPGVETEVKPVKEHRFVVVMRGPGLSACMTETDPQKTGVPPLPVKATDPKGEKAAKAFNEWIAQAGKILAGDLPANMLTLRGFSGDPRLPQFAEIYKLRPACIAVYPMYRGVAKLVGMQGIAFEGDAPADEFRALAKVWDDFDFFFIHIKATDSRGEDGDFPAKVKVIEKVDAALPALLERKPDVLLVTGDHSTPAKLKSHSWHPVPLLLWAPETVRPDTETVFGERVCAHGGLGTFPTIELMPLALAHAGRLVKFGA